MEVAWFHTVRKFWSTLHEIRFWFDRVVSCGFIVSNSWVRSMVKFELLKQEDSERNVGRYEKMKKKMKKMKKMKKDEKM